MRRLKGTEYFSAEVGSPCRPLAVFNFLAAAICLTSVFQMAAANPTVAPSTTKTDDSVRNVESRLVAPVITKHRQASEKRKVQQAKLINDRKLRENDKRQTRQRRERTPESADAAHPKVLNVSAEIGAKIYLFETPESFAPDFVTDKAAIGLSATHGPWIGTFAVALADKGDSLAVDAANASWKPPFGTSVAIGRIPLSGVSGYVADLNHWPSGLGKTDGLTISQSLEGLEASFVKFEIGGGVGNSFSEDKSFGFATRSSSSLKAVFGWSHISIGPVKVSGLYGSQNSQFSVVDDPTTPNVSEDRVLDANLLEGSAGLEFDRILVGGFFSQRNSSAERYLVETTVITSEESAPLGSANVLQTYGGGLTLNFPIDWSSVDKEKVFATSGYSEKKDQRDDGSEVGTEKAVGGTVGYKTAHLTIGLSYVHLQGDEAQYLDEFTGLNASQADRLSLGVSYKISE